MLENRLGPDLKAELEILPARIAAFEQRQMRVSTGNIGPLNLYIEHTSVPLDKDQLDKLDKLLDAYAEYEANQKQE